MGQEIIAFCMAMIVSFGSINLPVLTYYASAVEKTEEYYIELEVYNEPVTNRELVNATINFLNQAGHTLTMWDAVALATVGSRGAIPAPTDISAPSPVTVANAEAVSNAIITLVALEQNPRNFNGRNLVQELTDVIGNHGNAPAIIEQFRRFSFANASILFALNAVDELGYALHLVPDILALQFANGGFAFDVDWGTDLDSTALMIIALQPFVAMPEVQSALSNALEYMRSAQVATGGFDNPMWGDGNTTNTETTALALTAIAAMGQNPFFWRVNNDLVATPVHGLLGMMLPNGAFRTSWDGENMNSTVQGLFGLSAVGLSGNIFTNLRNPATWTEVTIPGPDDGTPWIPPGSTPQLPTPPEVDNPRAFVLVADLVGSRTFFEGYIDIQANENTYSILCATGLNVVTRTYSLLGVYVESIAGLAEFDYGPRSGWMFRLNNDNFPSSAASNVSVGDGYIVEWLFTRELDQDI